ncbi:MAG: ABC transporter permease [Rhizobacter sp.]|nr:ABC transporter permease [Rhizobacter sp.]
MTLSARHPWVRALLDWSRGWWQVIRFGAQVLVLAMSPSSYRSSQRPRIVQSIYQATMPMLTGFVVLSAIAGLVIIRIVLATALSYGLSRYALDVLVRTLVLELIPLSAAMFAALRYAMPAGEQVRKMRMQGLFNTQLAAGLDPMRDTVLPRALAGMFAVITLAALSSATTLVLTYISVYGFSSWGLAGFTRTVGQVFNPVIVLIFGMKTFFLSMAVAIIPMVPTPREAGIGFGWAHAEVVRVARLLAVVLLIEMLSLVGNYY